jgi:hypothetical protein
MKKTYRIKLDGDKTIYRTDGQPTHCCSFQVDYFTWERNTKSNGYNGWSGYISESDIKRSLKTYNPDNLVIN